MLIVRVKPRHKHQLETLAGMLFYDYYFGQVDIFFFHFEMYVNSVFEKEKQVKFNDLILVVSPVGLRLVDLSSNIASSIINNWILAVHDVKRFTELV